jgi:IS30 family transposase
MGIKERIEIYMLLWQGKVQEGISSILWYKQGSISKEIKKWTREGRYDPVYAQEISKQRRRVANIWHTKLLQWHILWLINEKLSSKDEDWSSDTIIGRMKAEWVACVCTKTVYNYINYHEPGMKKHLRHGKKGYKKRWSEERRGNLWDIIRIEARPPEVEWRETYYHWEADTIISWTRKGRIATLAERKSRYICMKKTSSGQALEVGEKIVEMWNVLGEEKFETITSDNGKEFGDWELIAYRLWVWFYFAKPYHSWERWTNENGNRCIRKHLPKWTEFEIYSDEEIAKIEKMINNKPRKILNYRTPSEELLGSKSSYFSHYSF